MRRPLVACSHCVLRPRTSLALAGGFQAHTGLFLSPRVPPASNVELLQIVLRATRLLSRTV